MLAASLLQVSVHVAFPVHELHSLGRGGRRGSGLRAWDGLGFRVVGSGLRAWGLGF